VISILTLAGVMAWAIRPALVHAPLRAVRRRWLRFADVFWHDD
jgi:hypothetical protein